MVAAQQKQLEIVFFVCNLMVLNYKKFFFLYTFDFSQYCFFSLKMCLSKTWLHSGEKCKNTACKCSLNDDFVMILSLQENKTAYRRSELQCAVSHGCFLFLKLLDKLGNSNKG